MTNVASLTTAQGMGLSAEFITQVRTIVGPQFEYGVVVPVDPGVPTPDGWPTFGQGWPRIKQEGIISGDGGGGGTVNPLDLPGWSNVLDEQFAILDGTRWLAYDVSNGNNHFGAPTRIQDWDDANVHTGSGASAGATNGISLRLITTETDAGSGTLPTLGNNPGTKYSYKAGMLASKNVGKWWPRYLRVRWFTKLPHFQGGWAALWMTAKATGVISPATGLPVGGATICEFDPVEPFSSQTPGKNSSTIHRTDNSGVFEENAYTNNGAPGNGVGGRTFFEAPTATPAFHEWIAEIVPVTDATGNTLGDPTQPSSFVRFTMYLDGVQVWRVVDTSALWWTTNGGDEDEFWNFYLQGCQVDGKFIGHPRDILGYSHETGNCLISGTAPNSCATASGGYSIRRATFTGDTVLEISDMQIWKMVA